MAPAIGENVSAPGASEYHCTLGALQFAGVEAAALKLALAGAVTVCGLGCSVIAGAAAHGGGLTVRVTSAVVVDSKAFVNTASNLVPDSVVLVAGIDRKSVV